MNKQEIINQLESLKENQKDFIEKDNLNDIFYRDIKAIEEAIKYINDSINTSEQVKNYYKETFNNLFEIILTLDYEKNTKKQIKEVMIELYYLFKKEI